MAIFQNGDQNQNGWLSICSEDVFRATPSIFLSNLVEMGNCTSKFEGLDALWWRKKCHIHQVWWIQMLWPTFDLQGMMMLLREFEDCGAQGEIIFKVGMDLGKKLSHTSKYMTSCWSDGISPTKFCASAHDKCAYRISFFYAHVESGAEQ